MLLALSLFIQYGQVLVQREGGPAGLIWTDDHVAQGFAWSERTVAFGVPDHDGPCRLEVTLAPEPVLDARALWAVEVPLRADGPLEIGTLFETHAVTVPDGTYRLVFEALPGDAEHAFTLRLTLSESTAPDFRVLKCGGEDVRSDVVLRRDAEPAG